MANRFNTFHHIHPFNNLAEDNMLTVEPWGFFCAQKELGATAAKGDTLRKLVLLKDTMGTVATTVIFVVFMLITYFVFRPLDRVCKQSRVRQLVGTSLIT